MASEFLNNDGTTSFSVQTPLRARDIAGRQKATLLQNIYEADFEYGTQPLRWEALTTGGATINQLPQSGGVQMAVSGASGDICIRQSRPYHRYQPGKMMYMATGFLFGNSNVNQFQRVGFFDDSNGIFFEQGPVTDTVNNPFGLFVCYRSDISGVAVTTRIPLNQWSCGTPFANGLNWNNIQMLYIEYGWYGAGQLRWGVLINGEPYLLHQVGIGNKTSQTTPWARTGNLPARYELRNTGPSVATTMYHYGVSVCVDGGQDVQRGFTYSYGMLNTSPINAVATASVRKPVLSVRPRPMGTQEYTQASAAVTSGTTSSITVSGTPWTANQWVGRAVYFPAAPLPSVTSATVASTTGTITFSAPHGLTGNPLLTLSGFTSGGGSWNGNFGATITGLTTVTITVPSGTTNATVQGTATTPYTGRITANTNNTLTFGDVVNGVAWSTAFTSGLSYIIGLVNRGQLLPKKLELVTYSSASQVVLVELVASSPVNPIGLTGSSFVPLAQLGSLQSFAERDVSATALTGGEVVYAFPMPTSGAGAVEIDLSFFFPILNTIKGALPDVLSVCVSNATGNTVNISTNLICQEAMS